MIRPVIFGVAALALTGCVSAQQVPVVEAHCLPLPHYTATEQQRAAQELASLPKGAELRRMMTDYGKMRAGDRACLENGGHGSP